MLRPLMICASLMATPAMAQSFDVTLGKSKLGVLTLKNAGGGMQLKTELTSTPMNVFNGTFSATSKAAGGGHTFDSLSKSTRKTRQIALTFKGARAVETLVEPADEMTALSDPTRVPDGVVDPVRAVAALMRAPKCPGKMTLYDGRRAIALTPTDATTDGDTQICAMSYKVIAGPGHLSPLKIAKAKMKLTYTGAASARKLTQIAIGSGPFNLTLDRQ